ncbi:hypothetical protein OAG56_02865 [Mariniblastus sp.]|jgi:hypothetical protein|nr:hypothetical protein [Mariniblastus sp.]MDB4756288.1 hypothetical protein [Mariniblastus sp.]
MSTSKNPDVATPFPVCRMAFLISACVITLVGTVSGLDPYVIFTRVLIGGCGVTLIMFFVHLWFSTFFF